MLKAQNRISQFFFLVVIAVVPGCATMSATTVSAEEKQAIEQRAQAELRRNTLRVAKIAFQLYAAAEPGADGRMKVAFPFLLMTEESKQGREMLAAQLKFQSPPRFEAKGRPSKKSRRDLLHFTRRGR